jgi:hypothetical protein
VELLSRLQIVSGFFLRLFRHIFNFSPDNIFFLFVGSISSFSLGICGKQESSSGYMACQLDPQESPNMWKCRMH